MPYVLCPRCGIRTYSAAPWSQSAECAHCGARLDIARHGSVETRIRESLYPASEHVTRIGAPRRKRSERP